MLRLNRLGIIAALALAPSLASSPAYGRANIVFSQYEGQPVIQTGSGGTKITEEGIDFWTSGSPPRRYQVIGMVEDKRPEGGLGGHAIGSHKIASKVKEAGGDAVIVQSQQEAGSMGGGGVGRTFSIGGSKTITQMLVVRYLPDVAPGATQ